MQILPCIARFPVDSEYKFRESIRAYCLNIKIEEIHSKFCEADAGIF